MAWTFQDHRQQKKLGAKAPWSVGWLDPVTGKRKSRKVGSKSMAEKHARKLEGQIASGTYHVPSRKQWPDFVAEYMAKVYHRLAPKTQAVTKTALGNFGRIVKPGKMSAITTQVIDGFIAQRQTERGKKKKSKVSPATINRELRSLKAALRIAADWGYIAKTPKFRKVREPEKIGAVISSEHFQAIYEACDVATMPVDHPNPAEWWRALLVFAITTGWRISEILSFRREDLDLDTGRILTRAADNKGSRDEVDYLTTTALEHVRQVVRFAPTVFVWPHDWKMLWVAFQRIQEAAGIHLSCPDAAIHECNASCHYYGFHALRRGYATMNCDSMSAPELQKKMRHRSFSTTLRYIQVNEKMKKATDRVYVPEFLKKRIGG
jgi:integrase